VRTYTRNQGPLRATLITKKIKLQCAAKVKRAQYLKDNKTALIPTPNGSLAV
jgi:hypothetical protein